MRRGLVRAGLQRGQSQRGRRFDGQLELLPQPQLRVADGSVGQQERIAHRLARDLPGDGADALGAQRIGRDTAHGHIHRRAGLACGVERWRECRFERNDTHATLEPAGDAGDQAAAADAHKQAVRASALLLDLARQRARARNHFRLVVRMRQQRAGRALALDAGLEGFRVDAPGHHDCGAQLAQLRLLGRAAHRGHEHLARHAQRLRGGRCRDAGIAARSDDHAAGGNGVGQQPVQHAAGLETAAGLQLLQLQPDLGTVDAECSAWQFPQRRAAQERAFVGLQAQRGRFDVGPAHSFSPLGSGNFTVSSTPFMRRTATAPNSRMRSITSCTSTSGAEAPAVSPTRVRPSNHAG